MQPQPDPLALAGAREYAARSCVPWRALRLPRSIRRKATAAKRALHDLAGASPHTSERPATL